VIATRIKNLGEAREMRGDAGEREQVIECEVAIADGIEAVWVMREKPSSDDGVAIDSNEFPASAPEPIGPRLRLLRRAAIA